MILCRKSSWAKANPFLIYYPLAEANGNENSRLNFQFIAVPFMGRNKKHLQIGFSQKSHTDT
jgi:hypothetical protein